MKSQPNRNYVSNDVVQTPADIAERLVKHFAPAGRVLEPCRGEGRIFRHLPNGAHWCEILEGKDFLDWEEPVDWIITNPPWSKIRVFLHHSMQVANEVVFLMTINHVWTRARIRDLQEHGFGIKEICLVEMPPEFPQSGFQLGAIHFSRGWEGPITFADISKKQPLKRPRAVVPAKRRKD